MQSWCWLIFQWLNWQRGFRLHPLGSTWPAAFGWIILETAFKTAWRAGALGACGLWGRMGEEQSGQRMLWRDVSSRGLQKSCSECCSKLRRRSLAQVTLFWGELKCEAKDCTCSRWLGCLSLPFLYSCACTCVQVSILCSVTLSVTLVKS